MEDQEKLSRYLMNPDLLNDDSIFGDKLARFRHERITRPLIFIGTGTCGRIAGSEATLHAVTTYLEEKDLDAQIIEVGCIGHCSMEPILDVQLPGKTRISFKQIYASKVESLLDDVFNGVIPPEDFLCQYESPFHEPWINVPYYGDLDFFRHQNRIVLNNCGIINPESIEEYIARGGYHSFVKCLTNYPSEKICRIIEESGLRGRGGGGFPTGQKWLLTHDAVSDQKYLVCNAAESDPGAFMDRALIEGDPHTLLEGIAIAAYAIGATEAYIYLMADYTLAYERLKRAIAEMKELGLLGYNIFSSGTDLKINIVKGPGAFVCGEETALLNSIEGKRGMPRPKPPYPATEGLFKKPTVVNNVETLYNVPFILRHGPLKFRETGTQSSSGTKVFSLTGKVKFTGLIEVEMGTSLHDIIFIIGGGIKDDKEFKAVQIGGPSGSCLPEASLHLPVDYEALKNADAIMGSGGMVVMDESTCMVEMSKFFMNFLNQESCGKCIPCREGTRRIHEVLENITRRPSGESGHETLERFKGIMQLEGLAGVLRDTSLCGLGQTAPNPLMSALRYFRTEFEEHVFDRKCRAGSCKELRTYYIDVEKCTGCVACLRKCPANAIIGQPRQAHFIVEDKCIGCGICYDVCKFVAVITK